MDEIAKLEQEDWLALRSKLFTFFDFLNKWGETLKELTQRDAITNYMIK